ncbi:serine hydrolase [Flavobacterium jejuense]|uniref:Serine hydrolase n=1 Tax=Flavobacterium jejuense TaxID=1544455 RepID=A0ABX0IV55_9FLAO|nr:serine hydrolase [Flavobacterium jejuense]NHN27794.1 serine hydrolase [Flavobacterium jejuense]
MRKLVISILFFYATIFYGQEIIIEGFVYNEANKETLSYATISVSNNNIGTLTNNKGEFKIIIPKVMENDSLTVSYIGYKTKRIAVSKVKNPLIIYLRENETILNEVVVSSLTADSIIEKALENIPKNYNLEPYISNGFYRVTSQKDKSYIHLSEAVFDIYQSKTSKPYQQFKLEKMRAIKDERASRGIDLGLNPNGIYEFDIVHNIESIDLLNKKGLKLHNFKLVGTELVNGNPAYKISFDQKETKESGYKGYMLLDKKTFAFLYFNFGLSPKGMTFHKYGSGAERTLMKVLGIRITMQKNDFQIYYTKVGNHFYLNNVGNDAILTFKSERQHYNFKTDTRVDYLVTKIETDNAQPFVDNETLADRKLVERQHSIYDVNFWKDYTIILPTTDFNAIAEQLEANNKANDYKNEIQNALNKMPKDKVARIDSILSFYNKRKIFNGNALIAYEGKVILEKSYNNDFTQNNKNSQFRIGSTSKTFTAMLILQLVNENKLQFSDTIGKFLPNYPHKKITIDQLLSHQSGIPNFFNNKEYTTKILSNTYTIEEVVNLFCSDVLDFEPGSKFEYSNSNFTLLSLIVEQITKANFGEVLQQRIFTPLDMKDTYFGTKQNDNIVTGYLYDEIEPKYDFGNVGGAGGIVSTTQDLYKWSKALENGELISQQILETLFIPRAKYLDWDADYGYGWMIDNYMFSESKKHKIIYHPGTDLGFYSMFLKQPDGGITVILLNNTGEFPRFEMTELILNEVQ